MTDETNELTSCTVCWESYEETGEYVPRILPCSHTLCEHCVSKLLQGNANGIGDKNPAFNCPECRVRHKVDFKRGVQTFPQNKYILTYIKRKKIKEKARHTEKRKCREHDKDLILYCKNSKCKKAICSQCLLQKHRFHEVVEVDDEKSVKAATLDARLESIKQKLNRKRDEMLTLKEVVDDYAVTLVASLQARKEEIQAMINSKFDQLIRDARVEASADIKDKVKAIEENLRLLDSIKQDFRRSATTHGDVSSMLKTVNDITRQLMANFSGAIQFTCPEYNVSQYMGKDVARLCGKIQHTEAALSVSMGIAGLTATTSDLASQFGCKVTQSVRTNFSTMFHVCALADNNVVVCGSEGDQCKLIRYSLHKGGDICSTVLEEIPQGVTTVTFNGVQLIVLSYWPRRTLDFHEADQLKNKIYSNSLSNNQPRCLTALPPNMLAFEDLSRSRTAVNLWILEHQHLKPATLFATIPQEDYITDMCHVKHGSRRLLITSHYYSGALHAYMTKPSAVAWSFGSQLSGMKKDMHACGISADGRGHLFVCDINNACVRMFDLHGKHLGILLTEGEQGLGRPQWVRWCHDTSSLIIAHVKNEKWHLSVVTF